eukprot:6314059-Amphidinium_carterae.1
MGEVSKFQLSGYLVLPTLHVMSCARSTWELDPSLICTEQLAQPLLPSRTGSSLEQLNEKYNAVFRPAMMLDGHWGL